ncbi:MAG: sigma-70 family RNA polymerase sigma factor [Planctomycetes bacterium]|nr:sigma-70 family RNA polymerase sigma factor [Planctomycetota bacterium]
MTSTQDTSDLDDETLLPALRAGDERAFATMVEATAGRLLAVARRFMRSDDEAHDVLQDAYLQAFRKIGGFEGHSKLTTWLHRIVVNAALMKLRSKARVRETSIEDLLPHFRDDGHHLELPGAWTETGADLAERAELAQTVRQAIDTLPDSYRNVILLRDIEGLSTEEAANVLEVSPNAVKTRLHRARVALRTVLDPHMRSAEKN